jgi:hypothetical protein
MNNRIGGGGQNIFRGPMFQQGYGVGGYFRRFFRWIVPLAEKHLLPYVKTGMQNVGSKVVDTASMLTKDALYGKLTKASANEQIEKTIGELKDQAESTLKGSGRAKRPKIIFKKRKKKRDIFS